MKKTNSTDYNCNNIIYYFFPQLYDKDRCGVVDDVEYIIYLYLSKIVSMKFYKLYLSLVFLFFCSHYIQASLVPWWVSLWRHDFDMVFCLIFMFCFSYVIITHLMELSILATSLSISSLHILDSVCLTLQALCLWFWALEKLGFWWLW